MALRKRKKEKNGFIYRSYNFVDKDPVIDRMRTILKDEGLSYSEVHVLSGISDATMRNWFDGGTRRPQYATVAAFTSSLGYESQFVKGKEINFEREIKKAKAEIEASQKDK